MLLWSYFLIKDLTWLVNCWRYYTLSSYSFDVYWIESLNWVPRLICWVNCRLASWSVSFLCSILLFNLFLLLLSEIFQLLLFFWWELRRTHTSLSSMLFILVLWLLLFSCIIALHHAEISLNIKFTVELLCDSWTL